MLFTIRTGTEKKKKKKISKISVLMRDRAGEDIYNW